MTEDCARGNEAVSCKCFCRQKNPLYTQKEISQGSNYLVPTYLPLFVMASDAKKRDKEIETKG